MITSQQRFRIDRAQAVEHTTGFNQFRIGRQFEHIATGLLNLLYDCFLLGARDGRDRKKDRLNPSFCDQGLQLLGRMYAQSGYHDPVQAFVIIDKEDRAIKVRIVERGDHLNAAGACAINRNPFLIGIQAVEQLQHPDRTNTRHQRQEDQYRPHDNGRGSGRAEPEEEIGDRGNERHKACPKSDPDDCCPVE